jgi:hypothetical protein
MRGSRPTGSPRTPVKALTGEGGGAVTVQGDTVSLNLAPFIATVKQRLVEGGFGLADKIPEVNASFVPV